MPFDPSGNFTRLYSWQSDRDNGIRILASKMDGEFDNFAGAMNQVFFRNGLVPMQGNLSMGQNSIIGLGAGSANAPSVRFGDDNLSGLFLNGIGRPAFSVAGVSRLEANSGGATVTGQLNVSTNIISGASIVANAISVGTFGVWHAGNLNPANYATLSAPSFTGTVIGTANENFRAAGNSPFYSFYNAAQSSRYGYLSHSGIGGGISLVNEQGGAINLNTGGANVLSVGPSGATILGNTVWHAGNLNTASFAAISGAAFTGNISSPRLSVDNQLYTTVSGAEALLNFDTGDQIAYDRTNNAYRFRFGAADSTIITPNAAYLPSQVFVQNAGNQLVWHAGNFNPANYQPVLGYTPANRAGDTFTGRIARDANMYFDLLSARYGVVSFDSGDYLQFDRNTNLYQFYNGGNVVASLDAGGNLRTAGNITANLGIGNV